MNLKAELHRPGEMPPEAQAPGCMQRLDRTLWAPYFWASVVYLGYAILILVIDLYMEPISAGLYNTE